MAAKIEQGPMGVWTWAVEGGGRSVEDAKRYQ